MSVEHIWCSQELKKSHSAFRRKFSLFYFDILKYVILLIVKWRQTFTEHVLYPRHSFNSHIGLWSRYPHVTDDKAETELLNFPKVIQSIRDRMEARHPSLESVLQGTLWHHLSFYTCNYIYILSIPYVAIMFKHLFSNVALHNDWNS